MKENINLHYKHKLEENKIYFIRNIFNKMIYFISNHNYPMPSHIVRRNRYVIIRKVYIFK